MDNGQLMLMQGHRSWRITVYEIELEVRWRDWGFDSRYSLGYIVFSSSLPAPNAHRFALVISVVTRGC
jgi:hypothetical protein